ncbi:MAG TPA: apolipoprotein N-acyltransferase [Sphingorhabdus sp.]|nr:apolipoprotein N-acyltransferase [Sphingorhabdus sp.]
MAKLMAKIEQYRGLALLFTGGISATGFAPLNLWPLTLLCVALLMHLVSKAESGKRAFLLGWIFGVGHFCIGNNWIATAFTYQAAMPAWLGWIAVFLLALYLAIYPALACWGAWRLGRLVDAKNVTLPFILAFAGCWIIAEWLRSWVFTGFAWNPLGVITIGQAASPAIFVGTYGLSGFVILATGALLLLAMREWRRALFLTVPTGLFFMLSQLAQDASSIDAATRGKALDSRQASLTIVQPNISQIDKYAPGYEAVNFSRLAQHSQPTDANPRLILWPEAAIPWRLENGYPARAYQFQPGESAEGTRLLLAGLMNRGDVLLTGVDRLEFDQNRQLVGARNSVTAMDGAGKLLAHYDKAHLVPYGEYLALRWLLEPLGATRLVPGTIDFWPGPGPSTLDLPFNGRRIKVGMQICYEMIFSGQVTDRANRPDFIFNPSNDAWFGSWGPPQHLAQARLRAIEEGLPVIRSTPTGISAVIDAEGRIVQSLPLGKAGRIDARLPMAKAPTLFARYGNILPLAFAFLLIALALMPLARRRASR